VEYNCEQCPEDASKETIAIIHGGNLENGLVSSVGGDSRISLNYAWMLAHHGHQVDLIGSDNGMSQMSVGRDIVSPRLPNLRFINNHALIKPRYDICIAYESISHLHNFPNADLYLCTSFRSILGTRNLRHVNPELSPWARGKNTKICLSFKDYQYQYPDRSVLTEIYEDFPAFPWPVPGLLPSEENFQRKEITWTTKHIYGYEQPVAGDPLTIKQIPCAMLNAFCKYGQQYEFNFFAPQLQHTQSYNIKHIGGLCYDKHIDVLEKSKIAINAYFVGSILESIVNGCLPLVWKYELLGSPYSNWPLNKVAEEMDCILCPSDGAVVIEKKIDKLMTDEVYYNEILCAFQEVAYDYTFEGSYKAFRKLIG
jgi:hypothetical protein